MTHAGVAVSIRENLSFRQLSGSVLTPKVVVRLYACLYRSHSGNAGADGLMEHMQSAIDHMLSQISFLLTTEVMILGLGHTPPTTCDLFDLTVANGLSSREFM